ncbi:MAG TPA: hypothetical protein VK501_04920 [Baekduia sp.]|uniref:hypothetical protein n=1 Tax=Baekduia sp. TaxID=2600305 RepID=UPI002D04A9C0|nr:hypothetical protein [Baekduia sp.]HMJ33239.1 hypothetical protein [Baekduia sp.]
MDPVRVQKSMFLLWKEAGGGLASEELYDFVAYNYGPMSKDIYADLDELVEQGLARREPVSGQNWSSVKASPKGLLTAEALVGTLDYAHAAAAQDLYGIKHRVAGMTFAELVEYVYDRWPEYEERTIFRRPKQR